VLRRLFLYEEGGKDEPDKMGKLTDNLHSKVLHNHTANVDAEKVKVAMRD